MQADDQTDTPSDETDTTTTPAVAISSVTRTGNPGSGQHYRAGESITLVVNFAEVVTISAPPILTVNIGGTNKIARCTGSGTVRSITCLLPIDNGDEDLDGIALVSFTGGTIRANGQDVSAGLAWHQRWRAEGGREAPHCCAGAAPHIERPVSPRGSHRSDR